MPATVSITLDASSYPPGATMTATCVYEVPPESRVSARAVLEVLGASVPSDPVEAVVKRLGVEDADRAWALVSDDGATAVFEATA